jgi:hypothetical protein
MGKVGSSETIRFQTKRKKKTNPKNKKIEGKTFLCSKNVQPIHHLING